MKDELLTLFRQKFNQDPEYFIQAPGRVNLIGEHTDYSEGFVLPAAINLGILVAMKPRQDSILQVYSADFNEMCEVDLRDIKPGKPGWQEYLKGVAWALQKENHQLCGWSGVIKGDLPIGAGLSSSAALVIAIAKGFSQSSEIDINPKDLALIGQIAENDWVGVKVGIMDLFVSTLGKRDHAVLIDCRTLDYQYVPIPEETAIMVMDTGTRRELSHSAYNARRKESEIASRTLKVPVLRDASLEQLERNLELFDPLILRRARHVISENERVHQLSNALKKNDFEVVGFLLNQSHASLRDDFEVSSTELNIIVESAQKHPACLGARMIGAGFGGCALALIDGSDVKNFSKVVEQSYHSKTGIQPAIFQVNAVDGASVR